MLRWQRRLQLVLLVQQRRLQPVVRAQLQPQLEAVVPAPLQQPLQEVALLGVHLVQVVSSQQVVAPARASLELT